ncbi:hypothetical protein HXX76_003203 [Chlamydomonas incerta]|uniref:BACK domain-containing protein n=1 Tax=Chlamydomonas incerta TaxID=51695 RepID=A0A835W5Q5_CHLIN|nr:hypothetical protein HXX76_003203 [Chlamydomonas incerta]|eukprot:KAG2441582.1 hypothetical protein HXX76_003203 [Chlamydomonas incerta]
MATQTLHQQQPGNARVVGGIAGLFGQDDFADCNIVFILDRSPLNVQSCPDSGAVGSAATVAATGEGRKRARDDDAPAAARCVRLACEPLPGHSIVLHFASDKIATQLKWCRAPSEGAGSEKRARKAVTVTITAVDDAVTEAKASAHIRPQQQLPELELSLGSEEELPAARAAIKFAYTGHVEATSVREALQVRRQAAYLQMEGCVTACLAVVKEKVVEAAAGEAAAGEGPGSQAAAATPAVAAGTAAAASAQGGSRPSAANSPSTSPPPVLEFFGCAQLWPDPAEDPAFAALLAEAKQQLLAHFGDALAVLNRKQLYNQMLALPVVGLEALLESDEFGTDSESSVVLLLAEWMAANYSRTDADTRKRLCGLLRLAQCSRAYISWVLPALAATHAAGPPGPDSWFPMTLEDVARLTAHTTSSEAERKAMVEWGPCAITKSWPAGWLSGEPRRQCVPAEGLTFSFSASLAQLEKTFGALESEAQRNLYPTFDDAPEDRAIVHGLAWQPHMHLGAAIRTEVGCFLSLRVPDILGRLGSAARQLMLSGTTAFPSRLRICVYGAAGGAAAAAAGGAPHHREVFHRLYDDEEFVRVGSGWGRLRAFVLRPAAVDAPPSTSHQQQQQNPAAELRLPASAAAAAASSAVAAQWADYLLDGKLTGSITLLPPVSE